MERKYWYWINNIEGIGNIKIRKLLEIANNPKEIFNLNEKELEKMIFLNEKDRKNIISDSVRNKIFLNYEKAIKNKEKFIFPYEPDYPAKLNEIYDKPYILYYKGNIRNRGKNIAIVGSRNCSEYGRYVAKELARKISLAGGNVISGLAYGIDSEAHRGAVMAGGHTYAILAGGVEKCYPKDNYNLYMDICNTGGIISEFPGESITKPGMFPLRNRIISGMSDAVIVVEAGKKSGSLITAMQALEQNRDVYAVPGRIVDTTAIGCNELIAEGAMIVTDFDQIIECLGLKNNITNKNIIDTNNNIALASEEKMLYSLLLDFTPRNLETLIVESGLASESVIKGLICLEIKGLIKEISKNFYVRLS